MAVGTPAGLPRLAGVVGGIMSMIDKNGSLMGTVEGKLALQPSLHALSL